MENLKPERKKLYDDLEKKLVNTPLEKYSGEVPNGNSIWIKRQCDSLFGSHYDLPYLNLFKHYETIGAIKPGDNVFETTVGSAGISCGGIGKILGYNVNIVIPPGGEKVREKAILDQGANLDFTDNPEDYVNGFLRYNKRFLVEQRRKGKQMFFLNHSMGKSKEEVNEMTLSSFEVLAKESLEQLSSYGKNVDYFLPGIGNGSSLYGPGRIFDKSKTSVIGFEPFQSALVYDILHPGEYKNKFGIEPGILPKQALPGLSFHINGRHLPMPAIDKSINEKVLDESILISDEATDKAYFKLTGKELDSFLPRWDREFYNGLGRTTQAGIQVCKSLAENVSNKNFLIIGYDKIERYDKWK